MDAVRQRSNEKTRNMDGRAFFLQGHAGTGKTNLLSLLKEIVESEGIFAEICATTGIAASLYRNDRTVHSFLRIGVENADSNERHAKLLSYGPNSERAKLICCLSLLVLVIDEASMLQRLLFEHIDTILKDLRCSHMRSQGGENDTEQRDSSDLSFFEGIT